MTTREQALEWWNNLPILNDKNGNSKNNLALHYYFRFWGTLTSREIEEIWRKETTPVEDTSVKVEEPQVDFEMLKETVEDICSGKGVNLMGIDNFQLFFKLLSTKPTFANVAYRELSKLNK